jgi:hypothetical protein
MRNSGKQQPRSRITFELKTNVLRLGTEGLRMRTSLIDGTATSHVCTELSRPASIISRSQEGPEFLQYSSLARSKIYYQCVTESEST